MFNFSFITSPILICLHFVPSFTFFLSSISQFLIFFFILFFALFFSSIFLGNYITTPLLPSPCMVSPEANILIYLRGLLNASNTVSTQLNTVYYPLSQVLLKTVLFLLMVESDSKSQLSSDSILCVSHNIISFYRAKCRLLLTVAKLLLSN